MIRLRKSNGEVEELPSSVAAIEICSTDGRLARVLILGDGGKITSLGQRDEEFGHYARAVNAEVAKIIELNLE